MATTWTEKSRRLSLKTPFGADKLLLRSFTGTEGISRLFQFQLDLLSEDSSVDFDKIVGQNVTFGIILADEHKTRQFNGYVSQFSQLPGEERLAHYQAEVVPWLWFLTRTADCRIFQNMTVPDIVKKVFQDLKFKDFDFRLQAQYQPWEYCVQYRETAFNFVSRLLELEGIFYFFQHEANKHILVLADAPGAHKPCPGQPKVKFARTTGPGVHEHEDTISAWRLDQQLRTGKYVMTDYNFETPKTSLLSNVESCIDQGGNRRFEVYDYPGEYEKRDEGDRWAKVRIEEEEVSHTVAAGESDCRSMVSGYNFDLFGYERRDQNDTYTLTAVTHHGEEGGFYSGAGSLTTASYHNRFTAIPAKTRFRPPRVTRKPLIHGTQTAVTVGPEGEEIYTDKYGRVKLQFHWDRVGQHNENSSCWVRVSQPWAGKNWGAMWIPRIGQEVVVDFLEGDPDRPLITGRVYNAEQMPPYDLPDNQTQSGFKSHSSKGGGGFNEIRFEDKKDDEMIYVHGQRELHVYVERDRREWIHRDRHLTVDRDLYEEIARDAHSDVRRDLRQATGRDHNLTVSGKQAVTISGGQSVKVGGNAILDVGGKLNLQSTATLYAKGMEVIVEGAAGLTIKACGSFITLGPAGVAISGPTVLINSGGGPLSGAAASAVPAIAPILALLPGLGLPGKAGENTGKADENTHDPNSKDNKTKTAWIEIQLVDEDNKPVPGEAYRVTLPDGSATDGTLDDKGFARIDHIDPGSCQVTFPDLDKEAWGPK